jgi:steroid delta-isomerase-like uncharacterized protein
VNDTMLSNKALVARHYAVFNGGDPAQWDDILHEDFATHSSVNEGRGRDRYRVGYEGYVASFSELAVDVHQVIAEDDRVVVSFTNRGRHTGEFWGIPATGRTWQFDGIAIYRIESDRIAEAWYSEDFLGWFQQLGVMPSVAESIDAARDAGRIN